MPHRIIAIALLVLTVMLALATASQAQAPTLPMSGQAMLPPAPWQISNTPWAASVPADDLQFLEVRVADDTFLASQYPFDWRAFGNENSVWFGTDADLRYMRALLRWNLPPVPGQYVGAAVYLPIVGQDPEADLPVTAHVIQENWTGSSVNWNTQPYWDRRTLASLTIGTQLDWYWFDVSNLVPQWYEGTTANHGLMLRGPEWDSPRNVVKVMWSREAGDDKPVATLVIAYRLDQTPPTCSMAPLAPLSPSPVQLRWFCEDTQTGVALTELQMREAGAAWETLKTFEGQIQGFDVPDRLGGRTYEFRVRATDNMTNVSSWTPDGSAVTTVEHIAPQVTTSGPLAWLKIGEGAATLENTLFVASDPGPVSSGVRWLERQCADAAGGAWQPVAQWGDMTLSPGGRYLFRVRAVDYAGNQGLWATLGPATAYVRSASGQVVDIREQPLAGLPLTIMPGALNALTTGEDGRYTAYLASSKPYTLTLALNGYRIIEDVAIPGGTQDANALTHRVRSTSSSVANGDFATTLSGTWQMVGERATRRPRAFLDTNLALGLGAPPEETIVQNAGINFPSLTMGPDGTLHLIWVVADAPGAAIGALFYSSRRAGELAWSAPTTLDHAYARDSQAGYPSYVITAGPNGSLAVIYATGEAGTSGDWSFRLRPAGQDWGQREAVPAGVVRSLFLDRSGVAHVLIEQRGYPPKLYYTYRRATDQWETLSLVFTAEETSTAFAPSSLWVDTNGTRHVMYPYEHDYPNDVAYRASTDGRTWSQPRIMTERILQAAWPRGFQAAPDGSLYAFWGDNLDNQYYEAWYARLAGGVWGAPHKLSDSATWFTPYLDRRGAWYLLKQGPWGDDVLYRGADLDTLAPILNLPHSTLGAGLISDGENAYLLRLAGDGWVGSPTTARLSSILRSPSSDPVSVSQRVIVPDLTFPTLSWWGETGRLTTAGEEGVLTIGLIDRDGVWHRLSDTSGMGPSAPDWSDLSPWRGQPVTLTFRFDPHSDATAWAWIDDVRLDAIPLNLGVNLRRASQLTAGSPFSVAVSVANRRPMSVTVPVEVAWPAAWSLGSASVSPTTSLPGAARFEIPIAGESTASITLNLAIPPGEPRAAQTITARLAVSIAAEDYTPADNRAELTLIVNGVPQWLPLLVR